MKIAELFSAGFTDWLRVDPKLRTYWHTLILMYAIPIIVMSSVFAGVAWIVWSNSLLTILGAVMALVATLSAGWLWVISGRRVASIGYRIEPRELKVSSGILFRRVVSVPFARMQLVEVSAGPLERAFNLASVQLHTASASTDATIPGLDPERAALLRDSLTEQSTSAGL